MSLKLIQTNEGARNIHNQKSKFNLMHFEEGEEHFELS